MLDVGAVPDDRSDDPRALPDVSPDVEKASFRRLLCRTGLLAAAAAEEEPPEEEFCSADAGVRPAGATRLDGATDNELPREALPASRDDCAADAGAVVPLCFGRPREFFRRRPLPAIDPLCPGAAVVAAVALLLLPAPDAAAVASLLPLPPLGQYVFLLRQTVQY